MSRKIQVGRQQVEVRWTLLDRVIEAFAPVRAGQRLQARLGHAMMGGGYTGASQSRRSLAGWNPLAQDADDDTLRDLPTLRARARDLDRNAPLAGGAVNTAVTNTVGTGLSCYPQIDFEHLGISEDDATAWQADTLRKYLLWAESPDCDVTRHQNFYGLQSLAFRSVLTSGDCGALFASIRRPQRPISLAIQLIEADRISNPDNKPDRPGLVQGVEMDGWGAPVAYHIASRHPRTGRAGQKLAWRRVDAFGKKTGRRNFLHLFERKRIGATRGVPFIAPIIEPLKQLERYTHAELMAAVVSGMFTVFIETEGTASVLPSAQGGGGTTTSAASAADTSLGNGLVMELAPGEKIESANPGRPNAQFDPFVTSIIRQIGLLLEIPYEILVKHYQSSYSAAKAAMNDAWKFFRARRDWLADNFCQPVYEAWLEEAVATGHVQAPGFFGDALIRRAWCGANWVGDGPGSLDPLKEALAARERVELTISTLEQESILHDGGDWKAKVRQRGREEAQRADLNLGPTAASGAASQLNPAQPAQE